VRARPFLALAAVGHLAGLVFASFSTSDFVRHLDRQVHGLHCSFIPGLTAPDASGTSGCHVTLMSPYSSVFRTEIWGGLPISLLAMGTFAFLAFYGVALLASGKAGSKGRVGFYALGAVLPALASLGMGWLSYTELHAFCKLCMGMYGSSAVGLLAAVAAWRLAEEEDGVPMAQHAGAFLLGVVFTLGPAGAYAAIAPDFSRFVGSCGELKKPDDPNRIMVPLGAAQGGAPTVEVFDPLCPSCRAFEERLAASGLGAKLDRKALLFPLDDSCNWMVGSAIHPGACDVSEAILCADAEREQVIDWAFEKQDEIREAAKVEKGAAGKLAVEAFPKLKGCVGSPAVKKRLNQSLRWAVANELPVLTPQVYVGGKKLCDEDTDLGMDWALSRLLTQGGTK
jgi:uncharacterized membrane protein